MLDAPLVFYGKIISHSRWVLGAFLAIFNFDLRNQNLVDGQEPKGKRKPLCKYSCYIFSLCVYPHFQT
jgi:hypothetical protein